MNDYLKLNQDRWNKVRNDYTEPLTHEELEEARNNSIAVALTVGKKFQMNGLKRPTEKRY